jgi:hypothetical protein
MYLTRRRAKHVSRCRRVAEKGAGKYALFSVVGPGDVQSGRVRNLSKTVDGPVFSQSARTCFENWSWWGGQGFGTRKLEYCTCIYMGLKISHTFCERWGLYDSRPFVAFGSLHSQSSIYYLSTGYKAPWN